MERLLRGHGRWVVVALVIASSLVNAIVYFWPVIGLQFVAEGHAGFQITEFEKGIILNSFLVSKIVSIFVSSYVMDKFGRKVAMTCFSVMSVLGCLLVYFATNAYWMSAGRICQGFYVSVQMSVVPAIIGETVDPKTRGAVNTVCSVTACVTNVFASFLTAVTYEWYNFIVAFPSLVLVLGCFLLPETPYYHLKKGELEKTKERLVWLKGCYRDEEIQRMSLTLKTNQNSGTFFLLFQRGSKKAFYTLLPFVIFASGGTVEVLYNYFFVIVEPSGPVAQSTALILSVGFEVGAAIISTCIIDRIGRRPVAFVSFLGTSLSFLALAIWFYLEQVSGEVRSNLFTIVAISSLGFFYLIGLETMPRILLSELFCLEVKGVASITVTIIKSVITIILNQTFFFMKYHYGLWLYFSVGFLSTFLGSIFVVIVMVETKGQTLEEIQETLKK